MLARPWLVKTLFGASPLHLRWTCPYDGYWSREAGAVVMLCKVDHSTFRDHVNYLDQLVDY